MHPQRYLDAIATDSGRFARASASTLERPIDFLGEWKVRDLVAHLGKVYAMVAANTRHPADAFQRPGAEADAPDGDAINEWFRERRAAMVEGITVGELSDPTWTWLGVKTRGWWRRRMAHETVIHRWDVEAATLDEPAPLDSDLAADGIDEYCEVSLRHSASRPDRVYPEQTLHLHRTDGPGEWMFARDDTGGVVVTQEHGKGDAAVRGPASSLVLWMWGRPVTDVEIFGDPTVAQAWQALAP